MTLAPDPSLGDYLGMSLPIVTVVHTDESRSVISHDVTVAYYLPAIHQAQPPQPHDSDVVIEIWPATIVYTRSVENLNADILILTQHTSQECLTYEIMGRNFLYFEIELFIGPKHQVFTEYKNVSFTTATNTNLFVLSDQCF